MTRHALAVAIALVLLTARVAFGRSVGDPGADRSCGLKFETTGYDLGDISDVSPVQFAFKFTNVSSHAINVSNRWGCGGFTPPTLTKTHYEPGESGAVVVPFNPRNRRGPQTRQIIVETDDVSCPRQALTLAANVKPIVYIEPLKIFFMEAKRGEGATQTVTVTGRDPNFEITGIEGKSPVFSVTKIKSEPVIEDGAPLTRITLEISLARDARLGTHSCTFILNTNDPIAPRVEMPVAGTVVGDIRATPPGMLLRPTTPETPFQAQVQIVSRSGSPFTITRVDAEGPADMDLGVDFEPSIQDGRTVYLLTLAGLTPRTPGQHRGVVTVETDIAGEGPFKFNWIVTIREQPARASAR